ncbi:phospho-sugar mutase [Kordia jejudonensis]|uniref:phospho-sugar mutase n=1 Tax=Kordia jejudonensis TaxID=1348245 RepID=UPI000629C89C|nr:phospho-sugar mutase [Kordia jejudonensis]
MTKIDAKILEKATSWLGPNFDSDTTTKVQQLIDSDPNELTESFYKDLAFGTGGMRGVMGPGTNRINKYTLGKNTQGLSNYLKKIYPNTALKVAIAYDCRHNSKELATICANVFSANDIEVFLFSDLRPTPELSFAVKYLDCHCGIVLTASHNPPEYNGYKVYWTDGGQIVPPEDEEIIDEINQLDFSQIKFDAKPELIKLIDAEVDAAFVKASVENADFKAPNKENLHIVFTSLHGTSITMIPPVLREAGYNNIYIVAEQATPDGDFPTVVSPNPEEPEALKMALELASKVNADIVIGTDPDSDRLGIAVRDLEGDMILLNGNQTMVVMTDFLLQQWKNAGKINGKQFIGSTIVSTPMMSDLANAYDVECKIGLTGFKWIAKMIKDFPELEFIGGGEESFGFMTGDFVRDKDAVTAALLACEIATQAKANGSSFYETLIDMYVSHGFYKEKLISMVKKGIDGAAEIKQMMIDLRQNPLKSIDGSKVVRIEDYQTSTATDMTTTDTTPILVPKSNVLIYYTEDGTKIAARPSGTEPKIKFYFSIHLPLANKADFENVEKQLDAKIDRIVQEMKLN